MQSYVGSKILSGLNSFVLSAKAEQLLIKQSDAMIRKITHSHSKASVPALYLLSGVLSYHIQWRLLVINLFIRVLAAETDLRELLVFQYLNLDRYKYNWLAMCIRILNVAGIKSPGNLLRVGNVNHENKKQVYTLLKNKIIEAWHKSNIMKANSHKNTVIIDFDRCLPAKGLLTLKCNYQNEREILGQSVQVWHLSNSFLTDTITNREQLCWAKNCDKYDSPFHNLCCVENRKLNLYKLAIRDLLPDNHFMKNRNFSYIAWRILLTDPANSLLGNGAVRGIDATENEIHRLARLACHAAWDFRNHCRSIGIKHNGIESQTLNFPRNCPAEQKESRTSPTNGTLNQRQQ